MRNQFEAKKQQLCKVKFTFMLESILLERIRPC